LPEAQYLFSNIINNEDYMITSTSSNKKHSYGYANFMPIIKVKINSISFSAFQKAFL